MIVRHQDLSGTNDESGVWRRLMAVMVAEITRKTNLYLNERRHDLALKVINVETHGIRLIIYG